MVECNIYDIHETTSCADAVTIKTESSFSENMQNSSSLGQDHQQDIFTVFTPDVVPLEYIYDSSDNWTK